jgi:3-deoxy-D-manno-octulosonic-acid transferase
VARFRSWLLNGVYLTLLLAALPWLVWSAVKQGKYREGFAQKFLGRVPRRPGARPCAWLHAVSVGEVNLLQTTLDAWRVAQPELELVISTTTKTGYDLARKKYADHTVFYCPLDFSWAVAQAMRRVRPAVLVLAELELWPNLILAAHRQGTPVAIINGRLSDNSFRGYRRLRPLVRRLLQRVELVAAQNEETADRFRQLGAQRVTVTGSLKFDGATPQRNNPETNALRQLAKFSDRDVVWLAGSTQAPEEQIVIEIFQSLSVQFPQLRLVLVPRHPERFAEVAQLLDQSQLAWTRRTQLLASQATPQVLLVDTVGELGAWWGTATVGFVGGSLGSRGGQNMLEPAAYGVATSFGPNTRNFRDIVSQLLAAEAAQVVSSRGALEAFVRRALEDPAWAQQLGARARQLVLTQQGATERTVQQLLTLSKPASRDRGKKQAAA